MENLKKLKVFEMPYNLFLEITMVRKEIVFATAVLLMAFFSGCVTFSGKLDGSEVTKYEKEFNFAELGKEQLFDIIHQFVPTISSNISIEFADKTNGVIICRFLYPTDVTGLMARYTIDYFISTMTVNVKDGSAQLVIEFIEASYLYNSGYRESRKPNKAEFESIKFIAQCEIISQNFETFIRNNL